MVPTLKNAFVGYAVGTSIAVIGLYIAFAIPIYLRVRAGEAFERGAWHLGRHYRWIDWVAVAWILFISIVFLLPFAKVGIPGNEGFTWDFVNYTPITVGAALLLVGGWYVLSAHKWFKAQCGTATRRSWAGSRASTRLPQQLRRSPARRRRF